MKKFTLFWLTGEKNVVEGTDVADAMNKAGYSNGALRALDFYANGDNNDYVWNDEKHSWDLTEEARIKKFGK